MQNQKMANSGFDIEKFEKYFAGEFNGGDEEYIKEIFCDDLKEKELRQLLSKQFDNISGEDDEIRDRLDNILYKLHFEINSARQEPRFSVTGKVLKWASRFAAAILLPVLLFAGIHLYRENRAQKEAWIEINAPAWSRVQFSLPDGTNGWLNSGSKIKYNGTFLKDRKVDLSGEAFFEVVTDKRNPFIVSTKEIKTKVLGTSFNIASYEEDNFTEVVLEEGKLIFTDNEKGKSYTMKPGDLVRYDKNQKDFSVEEVQPHKYISWTEGKLVFRNDPLDEIAKRLGRWYNVEVEINGSLTEDIRWRATFVDEDLEEVLSLMKRSLNVDYKIGGGDLRSDGTFVKKKVTIIH